MGERGPAPKVVHLKGLSGTLRKDTKPDPEPIPRDQSLIELPEPPDWLPQGLAREEWKKTGALLLSRGLLDEARVIPFATYCAITGKIAQKFAAGDMPPANLVGQQRSLAKELGIIGTGGQQNGAEKPTEPGRFAGLKARSQRPD